MSPIVNAKSARVYREDTLEDYRRDVERAIELMHDRFGEPLTVDNLAAAALMSRYHFTRVFAKITGVSPARFLAAIRMQEAKRLLLKTDCSVTDVCFDVGYNSLGTFARIFADFVGFPPVRFRQLSMALLGLKIEDVVRFIPPTPTPNEDPSITGDIVCDMPLALVTVALFKTSIPRSHPIECNCLINSRRFAFVSRPPRAARIFAAGFTPQSSMVDILGNVGTDCVVGEAIAQHASRSIGSIRLRQASTTDPPLVVAFPLVLAFEFLGGELSTLGEEFPDCLS